MIFSLPIIMRLVVINSRAFAIVIIGQDLMGGVVDEFRYETLETNVVIKNWLWLELHELTVLPVLVSVIRAFFMVL